MKKLLFAAQLLITALPPQAGWAGFCKNLESKEELENVYYIGILKHLKTEPAHFDSVEPGQLPIPAGDIHTIKPIQSFIGEEKTEPFQVWTSGAVDGWHARSTIFIDVVFQTDEKAYFAKKLPGKDKLYFSNLCNVEDQLNRFGFTVPEQPSDAFLEEKRKCKEEGKELVLEGKKVICKGQE